jgi:Zn-dependent peptidase ImmA (M78 family)
MGCPICEDLERAFEAKRDVYIEARSAAYYRVSTELAAYKNVDMERAKSAFEDHQSVCGSDVKVSRPSPKSSHDGRKPDIKSVSTTHKF